MVGWLYCARDPFADLRLMTCRKVAVVLNELGLTYESKYLDFQKAEHKDQSYTTFNPNGRIPTLIDHHNDDFAIW